MLKSTLLLIFCFVAFISFSQSDKQRLERELFNLPNVSFSDVSKPGDLALTYDLMIKQPIDHKHPEAGYFRQWVRLRHVGFEQPTVIETNGYEINLRRNEVEKMLEANNLSVEYRFFGKSVPDSLQWKYLTVEQATADLHAVKQLFSQFYSGKWISTGISKGGQTTLYYKFYYPEDVDAAIPYVAPIDDNLEDLRIYTFLDTIGTKACREKIYNFQKFLLMNHDKAVEKLKWFSKGAGLNFNYVGNVSKAFELSVLEYSFSFWQWGRSCDSIPTNKSLDDYLNELLKVTRISFFADAEMDKYAPHYYQAAAQTGYYSYDIVPFKKYIRNFTSNPSAIFSPKNVEVELSDGSLNLELQEWLKTSGNNILYIYGGIDTWSAARVLVSDQVNSRSFLIPGAHHGSARIKNLPAPMKSELIGKIREWTGLECDTELLK